MSEPSSTARSGILWITDIRKIALVNCMLAVLCLLIPIWNATQGMLAIGQTLLAVPTIVLASLFSAIMPLFYFALYRN
jgi:hypothetical protein